MAKKGKGVDEDASSTFGTLFRGGSVIFLGLVLELGLTFVSKVLIARFLGSVDYGMVATGFALLNIASWTALIGLHAGVARHLPRYDSSDRKRAVFSSALQIVLVTSVSAGVALFLASPWLATAVFGNPELVPVLRVFSVTIPFASFVKLTDSSIQGLKLSLPKVYLDNITLPVARFALVAVALWFGFRSAAIAVAYAASFVITALLGFYYLRTRTQLFSWYGEQSMHRELLAFSSPLIITAMFSVLLVDLDTFLVGYYWSMSQVGVYNVVYPLANLMTVFLSSFGFIFLPVISTLHRDDRDERLATVYRTVTKWITFVTLPILLVFLLFPGLIIETAFGAEYVDGAFALSILAVGFFVHSILGLGWETLTAIGRTKTVMVVNVVAATANVVINVMLIPKFSIYGAAAATTASYLLLNALYLWRLYADVGIHPFARDWLLPTGVFSGLVGAVYLVVVTVLGMPKTTLLAFAPGLFVLYVGIVVHFGGIQREERLLLEKMEERTGIELTKYLG